MDIDRVEFEDRKGHWLERPELQLIAARSLSSVITASQLAQKSQLAQASHLAQASQLTQASQSTSYGGLVGDQGRSFGARAVSALIPSNFQLRGSTIGIGGVGATSLALALVAQPVREGAFLGIVVARADEFGLEACVDFDLPLRRVVQFEIAHATSWGSILDAIINGFDAVIIADRLPISSRLYRKLAARNREHKSVLIRVGGWPETPDLSFTSDSSSWLGLGEGHGVLRSRQVSVRVGGRRHPGPDRVHRLMLPISATGGDLFSVDEPVERTAIRSHQHEVVAAGGVDLGEVGRGEFVEDEVDNHERFVGSDINRLPDMGEAKPIDQTQPSNDKSLGAA